MAMATTLGLSKVFILDKYFSELQKFWETEKRLQGRVKMLSPLSATYRFDGVSEPYPHFGGCNLLPMVLEIDALFQPANTF